MADIKTLLSSQAWIADAPALLVFCANNRRQRQMHAWKSRDFANDHLDAFFNASLDAGIALATAVIAAEAMGLGCCPISAIRDDPHEVSKILRLPDHVFAVAGLGLGYPSETARSITRRLPLSLSVHVDGFDDSNARQSIETYDHKRADQEACQTSNSSIATGALPVWSDRKTLQFSKPLHTDFGAYIRRKRFNLK